jgi:hypothetical protein
MNIGDSGQVTFARQCGKRDGAEVITSGDLEILASYDPVRGARGLLTPIPLFTVSADLEITTIDQVSL